jgi:elongation factor G
MNLPASHQRPVVSVTVDVLEGQIVMSGMNTRELEILGALISVECKLPLEIHPPQVLYLETIRGQAEAEGKYIRQTGGAGNYGHCKIRLTPSEPGTEIQYINEIKNGAIPEQFFASIEEAVREALESGILSRWPIVDVIATLFDGSYQEQDSNQMAYKIAASIATKEAARKASPVILEPVMLVEIVVPEGFVGIVLGDINDRRGRIDQIECHAFSRVVQALVPLAEMLGYAKELRHLTLGEATLTDQFAYYQPVLRNPGPSSDPGESPPTNPVAQGRRLAMLTPSQR